MNGIIYCATFSNGKKYVGQTTQTLNTRISQHKWHAYNEKDNFLFHKAIRKYGCNDITWEILEENILTQDILNQQEKYWISKQNSYCKNGSGYNMTTGGNNHECLYKFSEDELIDILEEYRQCGNATIVAKNHNSSYSAIIKNIKRLDPNWKQYCYEGKGHQCIFDDNQALEIYEYFKTSMSMKSTAEYFGSNDDTIRRTIERIDKNYSQYMWKLKIPKDKCCEIYELFKNNQNISYISKTFNISRKQVYNALKAVDPNYQQIIQNNIEK